ncbi:MAG: SLBB domain-containing protein [candidate division KSB1 bacterium]
MSRTILRAALLLLSAVVSSFLSTASFAQEAEVDETKTKSATPYRGAQYFLGDEDELLMRVNIWGFVRKPGQYMVPTDTDLISLISFAGGPVEQAKVKAIKIVRINDVALNSTSANPGASRGVNQSHAALGTNLAEKNKAEPARVLQVDVKEYLKTGDRNLIPALQPGDTIVVEGSAFNTVNKVLDFASKIAVFGQIYFWVTIANNRN